MLRGSGLTTSQAGAFLQAPMTSGRWTGPRVFSTANAAVAANTLYAIPFIPADTFTADQIGLRVATGAAGSAKAGIYTALTATNLPDALVAECSTDMDTTATANVQAGFSANPMLTAGRLYWLAACFSVTPTIVCVNHAIAQNGGFVWVVGAPSIGAILANGVAPSRVTRDAALAYVGATAFFPASFGACTEGSGSPGSPVVAIRKL